MIKKKSFQHFKILFHLNWIRNVQPLHCVSTLSRFGCKIIIITPCWGGGHMSDKDTYDGNQVNWWGGQTVKRHSYKAALGCKRAEQEKEHAHNSSPPVHKVNYCKCIPKRSPLCLENDTRTYRLSSSDRVAAKWKQSVDGPAEGHIYCSAVLRLFLLCGTRHF